VAGVSPRIRPGPPRHHLREGKWALSGNFLRTRMRGGAFAQVRYVTPVRFVDADGVVADVYRGMEREFGVVAPPILLHAPSPDVLAASWMMLREALLVPGLAGRSVKEAVAAAVSVSNTCPFCVTVHGSTLHGLVRGQAAAAIAEERLESVADRRLRAVAFWAMGTADADAEAGGGGGAPFPPEQASELIAVAALFHYLNRMVNVFLGAAPLPPGVPARALRPVTRVLTGLIRSAARRVGEAGESLDLLPPARLPDDLAWASGDTAVAQAFARAGAAVDAAGERSVPPRVRELVLLEVAASDGLPKMSNRSMVEDAVLALPESERDVGRLALLTALASYQVEESVVERARACQPSDAALVEAAAWASMAAARREVERLLVGGGMRPGGAG
jgi:AhpD family alkylhydroperoxidase